jgi:hypothetical protein
MVLGQIPMGFHHDPLIGVVKFNTLAIQPASPELRGRRGPPQFLRGGAAG